MTHFCAICGAKLKGEYIYSRHTHDRFCLDYEACQRRAKRRAAA